MTKVFKGWTAKILIGGLEIGCASGVDVNISESLEPYYGIENSNPIFINEGTEEITGSIKRVFVNVYYLRLMGLGESPFSWINNISFDLILHSSEEEEAPTLRLSNCRFKKVTLIIPQNGWLEENYDFIAMRAEGFIKAVGFDEPVDWGYFKVKGEIWLSDPTNTHGGGYISYFLVSFPDPFAEQGGGYFNR